MITNSKLINRKTNWTSFFGYMPVPEWVHACTHEWVHVYMLCWY